MSETPNNEEFEVALAALLVELRDPDLRSSGGVEAGLLLEASVKWPSSENEWGLYRGIVRPQLLARPLSSREADQVLDQIYEQIKKLPPRPLEEDGVTSLPWALGRAYTELAVPRLLDLIVHHWKPLTSAEMDQMLLALQYHLGWAADEPNDLIVEDLRAHPELRRTLRRIAHRHLGTASALTNVPRMADEVDGEIAVFLSPPELRSIRRTTHVLRQIDAIRGNWLRVARSLIQAGAQSIFRCVVDFDVHERLGGTLHSGLVLAPDGGTFKLEGEEDGQGRLIAMRWMKLNDKRKEYAERIELLKRVQELEQEDRDRLGRVPLDKEPIE